MSYGPPYGQQPPYGGQQGGWPPAQGQYGQQPPPQGQYGQPPHGPPPGQHGQHPPGPPPGQYGQPPPGPPPGQYGQQPGWGAPPPVPQHPQQQSYGAPPIPAHPNQSYGQPPPQQYPVQSFNGPPQHHGPPTPPSPGYGPPQNIGYSGDADADALRKAMKGFGTDEQVLISILARRDPLQINAIRNSFNNRLRRDLEADIKSETRSYFEMGLVALSRGPLIQDCHVLHDAMKGLGTRETELNDVLLSRSNADMRAIKSMYQQIFKRSLESDLRGDLSMKTERHFMMIVAGNRAEDSAPIVPAEIDRDVADIYRATEGKTGTDELLVCSILTQRNDAQIRTIAQIYEQKFRRSLETVLKNEFSGHMQSALLGQLQGGADRAMRDATALEEAMAGLGTKDRLLVNRVIRFHWNREHMQQVKGAYRHKYKKELDARIGGETSGDYRKLMLACL